MKTLYLLVILFVCAEILKLLLSIIVGDYNSLGIPKAPPSRPKSPIRPPPIRPPMPTTPKQTPRAGVISIVKPDPNARPLSAGDSQTGAPNIPHRPAPPVAASKTYQESEQKPNLSRQSSSSSSSSPIQEPQQKQSPQHQSLVIHDQDTGAIYEEINDDVVSILPKHLRQTLKFIEV